MSLLSAGAFVAGLMVIPTWEDLPQDYPPIAVRNGWSAAVMMDLVVDPDGRIIDCEPVTGFGNQDFASMFYALASVAKMEPARDARGRPIHGVRRELVRLYLPDTSEGRQIRDLVISFPADIEIEVERLPGVTGPSLDVSVGVAVDSSGRVTGCEVGADGQHRAFGEVACQQLVAADLGIVNDEHGSPVGHVRAVRARFRVTTSDVVRVTTSDVVAPVVPLSAPD